MCFASILWISKPQLKNANYKSALAGIYHRDNGCPESIPKLLFELLSFSDWSVSGKLPEHSLLNQSTLLCPEPIASGLAYQSHHSPSEKSRQPESGQRQALFFLKSGSDKSLVMCFAAGQCQFNN
jgi:hypothetical protein